MHSRLHTVVLNDTHIFSFRINHRMGKIAYVLAVPQSELGVE